MRNAGKGGYAVTVQSCAGVSNGAELMGWMFRVLFLNPRLPILRWATIDHNEGIIV